MLSSSSPQEGDDVMQSSKTLVEFQARRNILNVLGAILNSALDLLQLAEDKDGNIVSSFIW